MRRVLLTGMSGTGKSSALAELSRLGFEVRPEERELFLRDLAEVEPLLRRTCTHEIDATQPLATVVRQLVELGRGSRR